MIEWFVDIIYTDSEEVVYNTGPFSSMKKAIKAERGININLDHDHYVTSISFKGEIEE